MSDPTRKTGKRRERERRERERLEQEKREQERKDRESRDPEKIRQKIAKGEIISVEELKKIRVLEHRKYEENNYGNLAKLL